jgi:hypothetical protein
MPTASLLQLLDAITRKGSEIGVKLVASGGGTPALHFDFGFNRSRIPHDGYRGLDKRSGAWLSSSRGFALAGVG